MDVFDRVTVVSIVSSTRNGTRIVFLGEDSRAAGGRGGKGVRELGFRSVQGPVVKWASSTLPVVGGPGLNLSLSFPHLDETYVFIPCKL